MANSKSLELLAYHLMMTVFRPNSLQWTWPRTFEALPAGTVDTLLKPENKAKLACTALPHSPIFSFG